MERVKFTVKLIIEADADLDLADTLEILKENLENFQYSIGVKRIDVKMDKARIIYPDRVMDILKAVAEERVDRACR